MLLPYMCTANAAQLMCWIYTDLNNYATTLGLGILQPQAQRLVYLNLQVMTMVRQRCRR
jgi:hypothetical protein